MYHYTPEFLLSLCDADESKKCEFENKLIESRPHRSVYHPPNHYQQQHGNHHSHHGEKTKKKIVEGDDDESEQLNEMANRYLQQKGPVSKKSTKNTKTGALKLSQQVSESANNNLPNNPPPTRPNPSELLAPGPATPELAAAAPSSENDQAINDNDDDGWVAVGPKHPHHHQGGKHHRGGRGGYRGKPRRFSDNKRPDEHITRPSPN